MKINFKDNRVKSFDELESGDVFSFVGSENHVYIYADEGFYVKLDSGCAYSDDNIGSAGVDVIIYPDATLTL